MIPEPHLDPRQRRLQPTDEEVDAWAAREHKRRAAWLAGPSEEEKQNWARRYRWRATLGLEESRLGPTPEDIELWAEREHKRRQAWLAGPTEADKQNWAKGRERRRGLAESPPPSEQEVEEWAAQETRRRQEWLAGPSDEEKDHWAQRQTDSFFDELMSLSPLLDSDLPETAERLLREAELAGKGVVYALSRGPLTLWSYLIRAGRAFEKEFYQEPRRRRVRY